MNKKTRNQILCIIFFAIIIHWTVNNFPTALNLLKVAFTTALPIILGCAIAFVINIPLKWIEGFFEKITRKSKIKPSAKLKRVISLILSTLLVIGLAVAIIFLIVPRFTQMLIAFSEKIPGYMESLEVFLAPIFKQLSDLGFEIPEFNFEPSKLSSAFNFITKIGQSFLDNTIQITTGFFSAIFNFFLAFTFAMYLLLAKERFAFWAKRATVAFFPPSFSEYAISVAHSTNKAFSSFITGQLTEAVILGTLCFIGMLIFRFPQPGLISVAVGFTALIPVFGAWIGAFFGAFIVLLTAPVKAIFFLIFIIVLQQIEGNLIYPKVVGKSVGLPGVLVLTAVTVGGSFLGMVGMLLSIPICSVLYSMFKEIVDYLYNKKTQ